MARTTPAPPQPSRRPCSQSCVIVPAVVTPCRPPTTTTAPSQPWRRSCGSPSRGGAASIRRVLRAETVPAGSGRAPGPAQARVWPRCPHLHWHTALCPHASVPTLHQALVERGLAVAPRTGTISWALMTHSSRARSKTRHGCGACRSRRGVSYSLDGLQPDVGQEVLWGLRDCLSGECSCSAASCPPPTPTSPRLSARSSRLWKCPWRGAFPMGSCPSAAVAQAFPEVPPTRCHFPRKRPSPSMRPTVTPENLKKYGRGVRPWNVPWRDAPIPRLRSSGAPVVPSGVPSPMMADRLWRRPVSSSTIASLPWPRAWSGWKKGPCPRR